MEPRKGNAPVSETRCALYLRVSTDIQAANGEGSLQVQEARLRALASTLPGHVVQRVFCEEGVSGRPLGRPEMRLMLAAARRGEFDKIMVVRLDRLSRSLRGFCALQEAFSQHGVQLYSEDESLNTSSVLGRAKIKLLIAFTELEPERTAVRSR